MSRFTARLLLFVTVAFVIWMGVFTVAMVSQLADAADRLHTGTGQPVFWLLLGVLAVAFLVPSVMLLRLPAALRYPTDGDVQAVAEYEQRLRAHLARNALLAGLRLQSAEEVSDALTVLRTEAEAETQRMATSVLVSTALLQNGRLDGLVVLISQIQLVWRIAHIYGLRPSLRQLSYLYGNVGACVLVTYGLEEVDFAELTAPIVQAATPAAVGSIPGLSGMGSLLTNSLASGAANAFLTLRVGLVADAYCAPQQQPERTTIRANATRRAAQLLGRLVKDSGTQVTQAVYGRIKQGVVSTAQAAADSVKQAGRTMSASTTAATQRWQQSLRPKDKS